MPPPPPPSRLDAALARILADANAGNVTKAHAALQTLLRTHPADPGVLAAAIVVAVAAGQPQQALHHSERALRLQPESGAALFNHGMLLVRCNRVSDALPFLRRACELDPADSHRACELAETLYILERLDEAESLLNSILTSHPDNDRARILHAQILRAVGRPDAATASLRIIQRLQPDNVRVAELLCFGLLSDPTATPEQITAAHRNYGRLISLQHDAPRLPPHPAVPGKRPLLLAIVSHEVLSHSVASFLQPILAALPRDQFTLWLIHTGTHRDAITDTLAALADRFDHWPAVASPLLAQRLHAARADVMLETSGLTAGHRLLAVLQRPATLHLSAIGYPATTGVPAMDLRLVDPITDPPEHDAHLTERPLRLDRCFLCFQPPQAALNVPVTPGPAARGERFTFGSFNQSWKLSPQLLHRWAAILAQAPDSRLFIKAKAMVQTGARDRLLAVFADAGINPERVRLLHWTATHADHFALYRDVDLALDPWPYNGTTTVCEAMLMGVPTLALLGDRHASRVTASLNAAVGLSEFTAPDPAEYVRRAAALAADPGPLHSLRTTLRPRLLASPLCDARDYARALAAALTRAYDQAAAPAK